MQLIIVRNAVALPTGRLCPRPGRSGFTLVEALVVAGIVAVLAGLALSAAGQARTKAGAVMCLNHLRQWGLATFLYAGDHEDYLPPEGVPNPSDHATNAGWYIQLPRSLGVEPYHAQAWRTNAASPIGRTVWLCPANPRRSNGRNLFHYCLNQHVDGTSAEDLPVRLGTLGMPSVTVWMFDTKNLPAVGGSSFVHTNLHRGGAHFLFLDGRARRHARSDYRDAATDRGRTDHPDLRWIPP